MKLIVVFELSDRKIEHSIDIPPELNNTLSRTMTMLDKSKVLYRYLLQEGIISIELKEVR